MGDEPAGLAEEEQGRQLCPEGAAAGPGDHGQLHDAVEEKLEEELVVAGPQRAIDRGILPHELREGGPEKATGERAESAEPDAAALAGLGEARGIGPLPHDLEVAARVRPEALAGGRQRDAAAADEEDRAEVFLERLDPRADRRLPDAERDRGAAEASLADDLVEGGKLIEIHEAGDCIEDFDESYPPIELANGHGPAYRCRPEPEEVRPMIRPASAADAEAIAAIYRPIVLDTAISIETVPPGPTEMERRIAATLEIAPWLVYEEQGKVCGYAYGSSHRDRAAYQWSVDVSVSGHEAFRRRGI